ncbi:hypothetical protein F443_05624, partial [Phytophthora nicotianae P1569]
RGDVTTPPCCTRANSWSFFVITRRCLLVGLSMVILLIEYSASFCAASRENLRTLLKQHLTN